MKWYEAWFLISVISTVIILIIEMYFHQDKIRSWENRMIYRLKNRVKIINLRLIKLLNKAEVKLFKIKLSINNKNKRLLRRLKHLINILIIKNLKNGMELHCRTRPADANLEQSHKTNSNKNSHLGKGSFLGDNKNNNTNNVSH